MTSNLTVEGAPFSISVMMSSSKRYVVHLGCQKIHQFSSVIFALVCSRGQCWPGITFFWYYSGIYVIKILQLLDTTRVQVLRLLFFLIPFRSIQHPKSFIRPYNYSSIIRVSAQVLKDSLILSIAVDVVLTHIPRPSYIEVLSKPVKVWMLIAM
jgi:hypothetical protein